VSARIAAVCRALRDLVEIAANCSLESTAISLVSNPITCAELREDIKLGVRPWTPSVLRAAICCERNAPIALELIDAT
jgi:hypothetical protein